MSQAALFRNHSSDVKRNVDMYMWIAFLILMNGVLFYSKSCGKSADTSKNNSFLTGARMGAPMILATDTTKVNQDSLLQAEWKVYLDSALNHTSISQLNDFVEGNVTVKDYPNVKFSDAVNGFIRQQQQLFLSSKNRKK